ncbi:MAG: hypothetical protein LC732_07330, partial [Acidobacteria bacterium]|nr:hypothetical protein [Acidobacteriota bacterium]
RSLADCLYANFYCMGGPTRPLADWSALDIEDPQWLERLARANRSCECRDDGWAEVGRDGRELIVRKNGLTLRVDARVSRQARNGLSIVIPNEYFRLSPGFYMAASRMPFPSRAPLFRVYWNLSAEGAIPIVRNATEQLNEAKIPFRLKVPAHPDAFNRCDAAVLYVARRDRGPVFEFIDAIHASVRRYLNPSTPVFTKPIAPGIAVAEEPREAESFGESRCGMLASALIGCDGRARGTARFEWVRAAFARSGIPLHRSFLNPGSRDVYPLLSGR